MKILKSLIDFFDSGFIWLPFTIVFPAISPLSFISAAMILRERIKTEKFEESKNISDEEVEMILHRIYTLLPLMSMSTIGVAIILILKDNILCTIGGIGMIIYVMEIWIPFLGKENAKKYIKKSEKEREVENENS